MFESSFLSLPSYQGRQVFSGVNGDVVDLEDDVTKFDDAGLLGQASAHNPGIDKLQMIRYN